MIRNFKSIRWKPLILSLAVPLAVGGAAALLTRGGFRDFGALRQPPLSPPAWVFPAAWTALYIIMGIASYLVALSGKYPSRVERALTLYAVQLAMNFCWPLIFFGLQLYLAAFVWLVLLTLLVCLTALRFRYISKLAGLLMLPYVAWLAFAGYLNMGVYLLNRAA